MEWYGIMNTMQCRRYSGSRRLGERSSRRGSTFLIVLAILTLLVLMAATFTYTSRLEIRAAGNYASAVQARYAALSGLPAAATAVLERPSLAVSMNQRWADARNGSAPAASASTASMSDAGDSGDDAQGAGVRLDWTHALQSTVQIIDEGGKIALNSLDASSESSPEEQAIGARQFSIEDLQGVLERVADHYDLDGLEPEVLASSIQAYLNYTGPVRGELPAVEEEEAPEGETEDAAASGFTSQTIRRSPYPPGREAPEDEAARESEDAAPRINAYGILSGDPRFEPTEDEPRDEDQPRRFLLVEELARLGGMPGDPAQARRAVEVLSTVVTPYTQCRLAYESDGAIHNALDPNEADPEAIYQGLRRLYPQTDEQRLKQWAVNLVDWRDEDSVPTEWPASEEDEEQDLILGWERTPYINEVWPDSMTLEEDGDDGEYIELFNPYETAIDVNGWTLRIDGMNGTVALRGQIAPGGFLVITDDIDDSSDATPDSRFTEGSGSFFNIFDALGDGQSRRLAEHPTLNLPNARGRIVLSDGQGRLVDEFDYEGMARDGVRFSAQRTDPRIRAWQVRPCTPLESNAGESLNEHDFAAQLERDRPVKSPAELFRIPAYKPGAVDQDVEGGMYPRLQESGVGLDARLADLFALGGEHQPRLAYIRNEQDAPALGAEEEGTSGAEPRAAFVSRRAMAGGEDSEEETALIENDARETTATLRVATGRINLNTAPRAVLLALPGMTETLADGILAVRTGPRTDSAQGEAATQPAARGATSQRAPFLSISDFLTNDTAWEGAAQEERLMAYRLFANLITVNSQVFQVDAQNRLPQSAGEQRPSQSRNRVYMLVDAQGRPSALSWRFVK